MRNNVEYCAKVVCLHVQMIRESFHTFFFAWNSANFVCFSATTLVWDQELVNDYRLEGILFINPGTRYPTFPCTTNVSRKCVLEISNLFIYLSMFIDLLSYFLYYNNIPLKLWEHCLFWASKSSRRFVLDGHLFWVPTF